MPDDETWNAFNEAPADKIQHEQGLGDICSDTVSIGPTVFLCRKVHVNGDQEHEVMMNAADGRVVRVTWIG